MSRRRSEKSLFDDVAEGFERLPARIGLTTAAILVALGWAIPVFVPASAGLAGSFAITVRLILWVFALVVVIAAIGGAARRGLDRSRFDSTSNLDELSWRQFEGYLAEYFRRRGSSVTYRGGAVADGGVDLVLDDASGRRIVQAKHWKARSVGVDHLRSLWGVLDDERAQGAVFVTSGQFTPDAIRFAEGKRLELIGGNRLLRLIAEVKDGATPPAPVPASSTACPQCSRGVLEKKLARRGPNAGSYFLGCNRFPECRYTRNL